MARNNKGNYYGKLDEQTLIFRQIDRINRLTTYDLEDMKYDSWNIYVQRLNMSVRTFEGLLTPIIDEKFKNKKKKIKKDLEKENEADEVFKNKAYGVRLFKELISLLFRNNIYWGEEQNVVVDETKEDEEEAFTLD